MTIPANKNLSMVVLAQIRCFSSLTSCVCSKYLGKESNNGDTSPISGFSSLSTSWAKVYSAILDCSVLLVYLYSFFPQLDIYLQLYSFSYRAVTLYKIERLKSVWWWEHVVQPLQWDHNKYPKRIWVVFEHHISKHIDHMFLSIKSYFFLIFHIILFLIILLVSPRA